MYTSIYLIISFTGQIYGHIFTNNPELNHFELSILTNGEEYNREKCKVNLIENWVLQK
jgi:hypothetical protein